MRIPRDLPVVIEMTARDEPDLASMGEPTGRLPTGRLTAGRLPSSDLAPEWTAEQLSAIERREGDLLLDAGAGSGKTSVLVERFVRAVLKDDIDVAAILTITFTEKAAAELRDRIRRRLRALGATEAARATEGAFISTIHGFCARVLRAHALAAGIDPAFVVLDRPESERLADDAFDDALQELAESGAAGVDLIASYGPGLLRDAILSAYAQLRSRGESEPSLPACPEASVDRDVAQELARAAATVARELGAIASPGVRVLEALARLQRCMDLAHDSQLWPGDLDRLALPRGNGAALTTPVCLAYADALARLRAVCERRAAQPVRDLLDVLLRIYGERYAQRKREVSGLDFEDLELMTRDLLGSSDELRERYRSRFAQIMVDELQDTNRVQLELIESIATGNLFTVGDAQQSIYGFRHADVELFEQRGQRLAATGARATLRTNFRSRAEILGVLNRAFADDGEPALGTDKVDAGESRVGSIQADGGEPSVGSDQADGAGFARRFRPLLAGRSDDPVDDPRVELLIVDKGADWDSDGLASPWRLAEARALAARVGELVDSGAAPRQVVVLTRASTDMRAYERALEQRGIPTYVIGGRGYWSHPQVTDLVAYLRALANPREQQALYTVLASPMVGVSLDALVILAAAGRSRGRDPWWVLREPEGLLDDLAGDDHQKLSRFSDWFGAERRLSAHAAIEELIERALEQTGYDLTMLGMPGGVRRLANVRKLMRLGREYESAHGRDLRGFVELVRDRETGRSSESRESEAPVEGEALNAVRLMTIHRAKGLEFDIVCVADLGRTPRRPAEILRLGSDGRLGLRLARPGTGRREPVLDYRAIGDEQLQAQEREERRLFYVAMTRARERLIVSGAAKLDAWPTLSGGGPIVWIAPALIPDLGAFTPGKIPGDSVPHEPLPSGFPRGVQQDGPVSLRIFRPEDLADASGEARGIDLAGNQPGEASQERPPRPTSPAEPRGPLAPLPVESLAPLPSSPPPPPVASLSYSSLEEYARCGYRFYAERVLGLPPVAEASGAGESGQSARVPRTAAERGVLIHELLERLDFRRPATPTAAVIAASALRAGQTPPTAEEAEDLAEVVRRFGASELCARLGRATDARREERFGFLISGGFLVTGALDVLAREVGNRALVVDYKSDRLAGVDPAAIVERAYATQRLVYALAVLDSGAQEVEIAHCFLELPDNPVTATFRRADAPALERELSGLADGIQQREFRVAEAPYRGLCSGCPAEGGLCSWPLELTRRETPDRLF
jgi:ATP-dependent helicase/nuclease subunit A